MNERVLAKNQTSATPSQAIQASSPPLHQGPSTSGLSESFGSNSNISKGLGGIQPKTIRRSLNWQNISVEAPSRSDGRSSPGGIQCRQEEPGAVMGDHRVSGDSAQKSALESSNSTISTEKPAQKPLIARAPLNGRNIPIEAPPRSSASSTSPGGIQRLETSGVKEQQVSTESLQRQPEGAIQAKSSEGEPQEKEGQNKESVQTKLTVGAPGDKYEQEADSMAAKVMRMPDPAIQQPIQRQTGNGTEAVQMQPLVNSITPVVQRSSGKEEKVQMKPGAQRASDGSSQASGNVEKQLAGSKGGGSPLGDDVRSFMEPRFGADFSSVRAHTDSNAVQMNKELGAQAFAHGSDIYYGAGKSPGKNELTAHELTHTIQQGGAIPTKSVTQQEKKENKLRRTTTQADSDMSRNGKRGLDEMTSLLESVPGTEQGGRPKRHKKDNDNPFATRLPTSTERFNEFLKNSPYKPEPGQKRFIHHDNKHVYTVTSTNTFTNDKYEEFAKKFITAKCPNSVISANPTPTVWKDLMNVKSTDNGSVFHVGNAGSRTYVLIHFQPKDPQSAAFVIDTDKKDQPDPDLITAVQTAGGIKAFMEQIAQGNKVNNIDLAELNKMCNDSLNLTYLGVQVRNKEEHEWIPCDYSLEVINRANEQNKLAWVELQDELRSKTRDIIFKPEKAECDNKNIHPAKLVMQGHSGALYGKAELSDKQFKPLTQGQPGFHNALRSAFEKNKNIPSCIDKLQEVSNSWVWNGKTVPDTKKYHNEYYRSPTGGTKYTLSALAKEQREGYARINKTYNNIKEKYKNKK